MNRPPLDTRDRPERKSPTWGGVVVSYALVAAIPMLLWVVSSPVAGVAALAGAGALLVAGRHSYRLLRCYRECEAMTVALLGRARITITQMEDGEPT